MKNKLSKPIDRHIQLWRSEAEAYGHRQFITCRSISYCLFELTAKKNVKLFFGMPIWPRAAASDLHVLTK